MCDQPVNRKTSSSNSGSMEENNPQQNIPVLCLKDCGFFGSPSFDGFCSKCHRDSQKQQQAQTQQSTQQQQKEIEGEKALEPVIDRVSGETPLLGEAEQKVVEDCVKVADALVANVAASVDASDPILDLPSSSQNEHTDLQDDSKLLSEPAADAASNASSVDSTPKPKRNRCNACKKKVGLTGFTCRCGGTYCSNHRYSDTHSCSFDYRESGQNEIRRANPQIQCSKVQKI